LSCQQHRIASHRWWHKQQGIGGYDRFPQLLLLLLLLLMVVVVVVMTLRRILTPTTRGNSFHSNE
jgi:hypothetical protein